MIDLKTTVIIPTFNRPEWLEETLNCFEHQVLDDENEYDVIVVSDGCDRTVEWFMESKFADNDLFRIYNSRCYDSFGIRLCWNIGVHFSDADQIITIADDCLVGNRYVRYHQHFFEPYGMLMGKLTHIHPIHYHKVLIPDARFVFFPKLVEDLGYFWDASWEYAVDKSWGAELPYSIFWGATMSFCRKGFMEMGGLNLSIELEDKIIYQRDDVELGTRWGKRYGNIRFIGAEVKHKGYSGGSFDNEGLVRREEGDTREELKDLGYKIICAIDYNANLIANQGSNYFDGDDWKRYVVN